MISLTCATILGQPDLWDPDLEQDGKEREARDVSNSTTLGGNSVSLGGTPLR